VLSFLASLGPLTQVLKYLAKYFQIYQVSLLKLLMILYFLVRWFCNHGKQICNLEFAKIFTLKT